MFAVRRYIAEHSDTEVAEITRLVRNYLLDWTVTTYDGTVV